MELGDAPQIRHQRHEADLDMTEALRFTNPLGEELESHLQPTEVVQRLAWFLIERRGA
jgi:hypothetical protein